MHESRLLRELHEKLADLAPEGGAVRITTVRLRVGALAHVPEPTLRARWTEVTAGTGARGARLEIDHSSDLVDPNAGGILLVSVDVDDGPRRNDEPAGDARVRGA